MRNRLYSAFAILVSTLLITVLLGVESMERLDRESGRVYREAEQEAVYANLGRLASGQAITVFRFLDDKETDSSVDAATTVTALEKLHADGKTILEDRFDPDLFGYPDGVENAEEFKNLWTECHETAVAVVSGGDTAEWLEKSGIFTNVAWDRMEGRVYYARSRLLDTGHAKRVGITFLIAVPAVGVLVTAITAFIVIRLLLKRLRRVMDNLSVISEQTQVLADGESEATQAELSGVSASVAGAAADLSLILNGAKKGRRPAKAGETQVDALARQYADWADIPPDVRAALLILARRLGENKDA